MLHPYQCLLHCYRPDAAIKGVVVAASGSNIHTFNSSDGSYISTWPLIPEEGSWDQKKADGSFDANQSSVASTNVDAPERPQKRQKLSPTREESGSSAEIVVGEQDGAARSSKSKSHSNTPVIKLIADSTGQHVIAATSEDKAIIVFELSIDGELTYFSERYIS